MFKELSITPQFKVFIKNKLILICSVLALIINIIIWLIIALKIGKPAEPIALHYNIYFGIDMIGNWYKILILPLSGFLILIFNWIASYVLFKKDNKHLILGYFLTCAGLLINFILLISSIFLIIINS